MSRERVSVLVNDEHLSKFALVVEAARKAGLKVEQKLDKTGVITGTIDSGKKGGLQQLTGVEAVEVQHDFALAPPDSAIQ